MIIFSRPSYDSLIDHAITGAPLEICGILGGKYAENGDAIVETLHQAENAANHPQTEYRIDPETQYELTEKIESNNQEVIGFYHSHPNGPSHPSHTDTQRATWPGLSYCIAILNGRHPYLGSWRWNSTTESFEQEIVTLNQSPSTKE